MTTLKIQALGWHRAARCCDILVILGCGSFTLFVICVILILSQLLPPGARSRLFEDHSIRDQGWSRQVSKASIWVGELMPWKTFNEKRHRASVLLTNEVAEYVPDGGGLLQGEKVVWRIPPNPIGLGLPIVVPCLKRWRQFNPNPSHIRCCLGGLLGGLLPKFASASLPPRRQASLALRKFGHTRKSPVVCKWALESKTNATMMYRHQSKVLPVPWSCCSSNWCRISSPEVKWATAQLSCSHNFGSHLALFKGSLRARRSYHRPNIQRWSRPGASIWPCLGFDQVNG